MSEKTLGDKIKSWIPFTVVIVGIITTSSVNAYRLNKLENVVDTKVDNTIYSIYQLAAADTHDKISTSVTHEGAKINSRLLSIETEQKFQNELKIEQRYIKESLDAVKQDNKELRQDMKQNFDKIDDDLDELKDLLRRKI